LSSTVFTFTCLDTLEAYYILSASSKIVQTSQTAHRLHSFVEPGCYQFAHFYSDNYNKNYIYSDYYNQIYRYNYYKNIDYYTYIPRCYNNFYFVDFLVETYFSNFAYFLYNIRVHNIHFVDCNQYFYFYFEYMTYYFFRNARLIIFRTISLVQCVNAW